jgi:hypothetical protein
MCERNRGHLPLFTSVAVLAVCLCSMVEARQWRYHDHQGSRAGVGDQVRERRGEAVRFAAAIDGMIGACWQEAVDLKTISLDFVPRVVQLTDEQRAALANVRSAVQAAVEPLDANCPKEIGVQVSEKTAALDHALRLMADSLQSLRLALADFYRLLDDEQKAQLLAMGLSNNQLAQSKGKPTRRQSATDTAAYADRKSMCVQWTDSLRSWPVREIDSATALSDFQRASLYALAAAIYRSAGDLAQACPAQNRLTPVSRLEARENLLRALQRGMEAIQPSAAAFEKALSEEQKNVLDATIGTSPLAFNQ